MKRDGGNSKLKKYLDQGSWGNAEKKVREKEFPKERDLRVGKQTC